jgi:hypothetical protein
VDHYEFLAELHRILRPRTYLEIGVATGQSLAQSRTQSIAIDLRYKISEEIQCDVQLVRATSDDFFARPTPTTHFGGKPIDLAFIDGMHLFEYALRDFMNVERYSCRTTTIVLDDILPRTAIEAARNRQPGGWTGDVYKILPVLHEYRPELVLLPVHTQPTGVLVVLGADSSSTVLHDSYDEIVKRYVTPDPQQVPESLLKREFTVPPKQVLTARFWKILRGRRLLARTRRIKRVYASLERAFTPRDRINPAIREMITP